MLKTIVKLVGSGIDQIVLGSSPATWNLSEGVSPAMTTVDLPTKISSPDGKTFTDIDLHGIYDLHMESGGSKLIFKNIYPLRQIPGNVPEINRWLLTDRRYWWSYSHIGPRRYNWRRNVSFKRMRDIKGPTPDLIQDILPVVQYAPWSLREPENNSPRPWTGKEILIDVLETLIEFESSFSGDDGSFVKPEIIFKNDDDSDFANTLDEIPVENLLIDDPGNQAIARVLSYLPGVGIYIDFDGNYCVFSTASATDIAPGSPKVGSGIASWIKNRRTRPKKIHVLFTRECEIRFDFWEEAEVPSDQSVPVDVPPPETRLMKNVLGVPDFNLQIRGKDRPMGSWVTFDDALAEWNKEEVPGFGTIDYNLIRKAAVPFLDLWAGIQALGQREPNANWSGRINAINMHYRKTFQIDQRFWSRILSIRASRLALIDQATGARAPAGVFSDYCRLGSQRSFFRDLQAGVDLSYAMNQKGYPLDKGANLSDPADRFPLDSVTRFSDAKVAVADPDQGVIHIEFIPDEHRVYEMALPSMMEIPGGGTSADGRPLNPGPTANITDRNNPITFDAINTQFAGGNFANVPQLSSEHRVAIILTAIPATWNNRDKEGKVKNNQLHRITIDPTKDGEELKKLMVGSAAESFQDAQGPEMFIRVGSGVEVAKIAWLDSRKDDIEKVFGIGDGTEPDLTGLVLNEGDSEKGASLNSIALGVAAQVYSEMADHWQGGKSINLQRIFPQGNLQEVSFQVSTNGEGSTVLDYPEKLEKFDLMAFLDPSTRATIMKLARPGD